jgi:hypothetical protein
MEHGRTIDFIDYFHNYPPCDLHIPFHSQKRRQNAVFCPFLCKAAEMPVIFHKSSLILARATPKNRIIDLLTPPFTTDELSVPIRNPEVRVRIILWLGRRLAQQPQFAIGSD